MQRNEMDSVGGSRSLGYNLEWYFTYSFPVYLAVAFLLPLCFLAAVRLATFLCH